MVNDKEEELGLRLAIFFMDPNFKERTINCSKDLLL